ncbi:hypothetical protein HYFRA_00007515 [Hymenoscyphus fraxineus]|uniref:Uncharacterized protein n=1 Tax=Hymenoscyphus fraxineus TaxID=746836 RepID=A0A9N9KPP7_9HELO|nr:hypothetical protein HYFRA_00007515 [Hymenoscyphus fraxineus]
MQSTTLIWLFLGLLTLVGVPLLNFQRVQLTFKPDPSTPVTKHRNLFESPTGSHRSLSHPSTRNLWCCFDMDFHHGWSEIADNKASLVIEELLKYKTKPVYKKGCVRVMCIGNTSVTVCNDNDHVVTVSTDTMAAFVGAVQDVCGRKFKKKLDDECGQTFDEKNFNVIVRAENCNDIVVEPPE